MSEADAILVIEDDPVLGSALIQRLRLEGFQPRLATTGAAALREIERYRPAAIVSDIRLPDMSGEEVYRHVVARFGTMPVFFMTAFADVAQAVRLVKAGARDYQTKPVNVDQLVESLRHACRTAAPAVPAGQLGVSPAMRAVEETLRKAARVDLPVLITGATGVGKEVAATFLHRASPVAAEPFVAVNCAAIPHDLVESTLFGHEKGAFTGAVAKRTGLVERAGRGTLFLDEIGDLAIDLQAKLLRLIQERSFLSVGSDTEKRSHARVLCATHADLAQRVRDGKFREDLYYRLNVIEIRIPSLRERPEDICWLAERFIQEAAGRFGIDPRPLSAEAVAALQSHDWPGNIRELRNRIERAMALTEGPCLSRLDLFPEASLDHARPQASPATLDEIVSDALRTQVIEALRRAGNNRGEAARLLGISRTTLWKRMRDLKLT